jgi:hypothetical protein
VLEPLIHQLEEMDGYQVKEDVKVSALAFADYLILIADKTAESENLLQKTEKYLGNLGMMISAYKCTAIRIHTTRDLWYLDDPNIISKDGVNLPIAPTDSTIRYLGGVFSPWKGLIQDGLTTQLEGTLQRVQKLPLKPHQKVHLITTYLTPPPLFTLVNKEDGPRVT